MGKIVWWGPEMYMPVITGAVGAEAVTPDPGLTRRLGPLSGATPKRPKYELLIRPTQGPGWLVPGAAIQPGNRPVHIQNADLTYPGPGRQLPGTRTQPVLDQLNSEADLMDTVAHLQLEVEALKFVQS